MPILLNENEKELQDIFENFLFKMDDRLERIINVTKESKINLDYSLQSFDKLEDFILENNINENHELYDDIACYIGEVVRKNYGGKWECCLDKKENSFFYGMPVISGYNKYGVLLSPYEMLRLFILRKKKGMFAKHIELDVNPPELE